MGALVGTWMREVTIRAWALSAEMEEKRQTMGLVSYSHRGEGRRS